MNQSFFPFSFPSLLHPHSPRNSESKSGPQGWKLIVSLGMRGSSEEYVCFQCFPVLFVSESKLLAFRVIEMYRICLMNDGRKRLNQVKEFLFVKGRLVLWLLDQRAPWFKFNKCIRIFRCVSVFCTHTRSFLIFIPQISEAWDG